MKSIINFLVAFLAIIMLTSLTVNTNEDFIASHTIISTNTKKPPASRSIDFERLPSGTATSHEQRLRFEYIHSYGVRFPKGIIVINCATDGRCVGPTNSKVVKTFPTGSEFERHPLEILFNTAQEGVTLLVSPDSQVPVRITMKAFDAAGRRIGENSVDFGASERNGNKRLKVSDAQNRITKVEVTAGGPGQPSHNFFTSDQLSFHGATVANIGTDKERPQITILTPAKGQKVSTSPVPFHIRVTDNDELLLVDVKVVHEDTGTTVTDYSSGNVCGGGGGIGNCPATNLDQTVQVALTRGPRLEGRFRVSFMACDRSGNCTESSRTITFAR